MRRRDFIVFLGGTTVWPLTARAEQPTPTAHRLGILMQPSAQAAKARGFLDVFIQALKEAGWVEGQNVIIERRFADGKEEQLANLAAELVQLRVDAIVTDSTPSARAAKNATQSVPIVMAASGDAVANGLVDQLQQTRRQCYRHECPDERLDRQAAAAADRDDSQS
jgi:putative tryptophan/tyrosine transport system substrate-binding protein